MCWLVLGQQVQGLRALSIPLHDPGLPGRPQLRRCTCVRPSLLDQGTPTVCLWTSQRGYRGLAGGGLDGAGHSWFLRHQLQKTSDTATPAGLLSDKCTVSGFLEDFWRFLEALPTSISLISRPQCIWG